MKRVVGLKVAVKHTERMLSDDRCRSYHGTKRRLHACGASKTNKSGNPHACFSSLRSRQTQTQPGNQGAVPKDQSNGVYLIQSDCAGLMQCQ